MTNKNFVIELHNLCKTYRLYAKKTDRFREFFSSKKSHQLVSVLNNLSLSIKKGEVVGIVGENGAGKSTLLKIIAGTIPYTSGSLSINGRVTAILELGTGFHPEFTGRENVYLGGLCIGMSRSEINSKIDEIIEFSELGDVIDQPFKTYSSGMQARLTFSTVVSAEPDILIVDEALSVGDARFQLKSFQKIQEFRKSGKTIILVSHDHNTIAGFCDRAILLSKGNVIADGEPSGVCELYHQLLFGRSKEEKKSNIEPEPSTIESDENIPSVDIRNPVKLEGEKRTFRFGTNEAEILGCYITPMNSLERSHLLHTGSAYRFVLRMIAHKNLEKFCVGFVIRSSKGVDLFGTDTNYGRSTKLPALNTGDILEVNMNVTMWLAAGSYFLTVGIADENGTKYDLQYDALEFKVIGSSQLYTTSVVNLDEKIDFLIFSVEGYSSTKENEHETILDR